MPKTFEPGSYSTDEDTDKDAAYLSQKAQSDKEITPLQNPAVLEEATIIPEPEPETTPPKAPKPTKGFVVTLPSGQEIVLPPAPEDISPRAKPMPTPREQSPAPAISRPWTPPESRPVKIPNPFEEKLKVGESLELDHTPRPARLGVKNPPSTEYSSPRPTVPGAPDPFAGSEKLEVNFSPEEKIRRGLTPRSPRPTPIKKGALGRFIDRLRGKK